MLVYDGMVKAVAGALVCAGLAYSGPGIASPQTDSAGATDSQPASLPIERDPVLQARLQQALRDKGKAYSPRTQHIDSQGHPVYTNRLILEASPYLLQHAHNPVDWYPWGPEAFAKARRENKPVFLSIGYSTCHWCHVMEKESFENEQTARILNEYFVPIKVDRERRPDVDASYMTAVQLLTGRGGWPMSSFLTPAGNTFFGGTYFPPEQFVQILQKVHATWMSHQAELIAQGDRIAATVASISASQEKAESIGSTTVADAVRDIMSHYDERLGGFSGVPKFPNEPSLFLLLNQAQRTSDKAVISALEHTLDMMARGGIYDQVGGGFHRYSTDKAWLVPHFEKMLYNQAHLSRIYLQAWRLTGNPEFARVPRETLDYVLREMTASGGGFYSATDADSEGEEGRYFLWTPQQIRATLDKHDAQLALDFYDVTVPGNFEGRNILHWSTALADYGAEHGLDVDNMQDQLDRINLQLLAKRQKRVAPLRDEKIITAWNGMMITTLAYAGDQLDEPRYLEAAIRAADFIWSHSRDKQGNVLRSNLDGQASVAASQEDYAYLAESFLMLFDVTGERRWLQRAAELTDVMLARFWDSKNGGFYMTSDDAPAMAMGRIKDSQDAAIPSGNSVGLQVLQKMSRRSGNFSYDEHAQEMLSAFAPAIRRNPSAYAYLLSAAADLFQGETGAHQFGAKGAVAVGAVMSGTRLTLNLSILPGWHINAHHPLQAYLIPTDVRLPGDTRDWRLSPVEYPASTRARLGFLEEPLAVYEGQVILTADLVKTDDIRIAASPVIQLRIQACNNKACLPPETLRIRPLLR